MTRLSKNCFCGAKISSLDTIVTLSNSKQSVYTLQWGIKPAKVLTQMPLHIINNLIEDGLLYFVININKT